MNPSAQISAASVLYGFAGSGGGVILRLPEADTTNTFFKTIQGRPQRRQELKR